MDGTMTNLSVGKTVSALIGAAVLASTAIPAAAQDADSRLRRLEAEVRAIKRDISPNGQRTVAPQAVPPTGIAAPGTPATTAVSDLLVRVDALENQLTRLTAQNEEATHQIRQLETRLATAEAALRAPGLATGNDAKPDSASQSPAAPGDGAAASANLAAMSGGSSTARPAAVAAKPAAPVTAAPSVQRLAAVRAIEKPQTSDPGDDEYSYGFRLWDAKFYPEAGQQLKLFLDKYPRHPRVTYARNLMGRALLDEGKPREAATWFLQNYQTDKLGARAPDSLLYLAEAMRQLKDKNRACIALSEFAETYPAEATGRLKGLYDEIRQGVACN
jgi:TolA-binding protein